MPSTPAALSRSASTVLLGVLLAAPFTLPAPARGSALPFEELVACQREIEEVRWAHRIWPSENPGSKPPLSEVLPEERIRERVRDVLAGSRALEERWNAAVDGASLRAETERMARETRDPGRLEELWRALDHDPLLVAECLARPLLVERRLRARFARDPEIHGDLRRRAEDELRSAGSAERRSALGAVLREVEWTVDGSDEDEILDREALERRIRWLEPAAGTSSTARVEQGFGPLQETDRSFVARALLDVETGPDGAARSARVLVAEWPKRTFDAWWRENRGRWEGSDLEVATPTDRPPLPRISSRGAAPCTDGTWAPIEPDRRIEHTAVWTGSEMIVWGGRDALAGGGVLATGSAYDPTTDSWTSLSTADAPSPRQGHTAVWTGSEMVVWGGRGSTTIGFSSGSAWDPVSEAWTALPTGGDSPTSRFGHTAVWAENEGLMVVWGGIGSCFGGVCSYRSGGSAWDPVAETWTALPTIGEPDGRHGHTAVTDGSNVLIWGGRDDDGYFGDGALLSLSGMPWSWASFPTTDAPAPRSDHTAVWTGTQMIVWGGRDESGPRADGGRYVILGWDSISATDAPAPAFDHAAVWTGSRMVVWGGELTDGTFSDTIHEYRPDLDDWSSSPESAPPRSRHTAVSTGGEVLVWGGRDGFGVLASGERWPVGGGLFDLEPIAGDSAPSPRYSHEAVWTGAEMFVWGGGGVSLLDTGGLWEPATSTWRATSRTDAPEPRRTATATWTGTEVLIFGGGGAGKALGGRFSPTGNSWAPMSETSAPTSRFEHAAVWSGSELLIWGGNSGGEDTRSGGRYDPGTDTWSPMSETGAPGAISKAGAVWSGSHLIVHGGDQSGPSIPSGKTYRYDPVLDAWTQLADGLARSSPETVWTGDRMIVWDRAYLDGPHASLYDPAADEWTHLQDTDFVDSRSGPMVWTGSEALIWSQYGAEAQTYLYRLDPKGPTLAGGAVLGDPPELDRASWVWAGDRAILWGGSRFDDTFGSRNENAGWAYCWSGSLFHDGFESGSTSAWSP